MSTYNITDASRIIDQIVARAVGVAPLTDQAALDMLQVRAQCKEAVDKIVRSGGGKSDLYAGYATGAVTKASDLTPGMVLMNGTTHIMVITKVTRDAVGRLMSVDVRESNYESNWSRPPGAVPWQRKWTARTIPASNPKVMNGSLVAARAD